MSTMTNPTFLYLRRTLRKLGLTPLLGRFIAHHDYEGALAARMETQVQEGDCVWDVGANVGLYTQRFSRIVGVSGRVIAFEPSRANAERLRDAVGGCANVTILEVGLSDRNERGALRQGGDTLGATSRVVLGGGSDTDADVELCTARSIVESGRSPAPNIVKIDVEGHEYEVLRGFKELLANPTLRDIFIEVHFGILDASGRYSAPREIVAALERAAFQTTWLDPSHLHAGRVGENRTV
jgi:FkbM family methyltransferase